MISLKTFGKYVEDCLNLL